MAKQEKIHFLEFKERFNSEQACRDYLYQMRWPDGFVCPRCGHTSCYNITTRNRYECTACHYQASVISGTVMERTHIPLEKWFWGIYLFGIDKRGCSATQLMKMLEISYTSAWYMLHRIRKAMEDRDARYQLCGIIELDDSYFGSPTKDGKRGRGTEKSKVIAGISLDEKGRPQYLKMEVVPDLKQETIHQFVQEHIGAGSTLETDAYASYVSLQQSGDYVVSSRVYDPKMDPKYLKWLHIVISNAKAFILGTFHGLGQKHLQRYLDEFCYRFNRRYHQDELFSRILCSCLATGPITFTELTR